MTKTRRRGIVNPSSVGLNVNQEENERTPLLRKDCEVESTVHFEIGVSEESEFVQSFRDDEEEALSFITPTAETEHAEAGNAHLISQKYESLDYDQCENTVFLEDQRGKGYAHVVKTGILRWIIIFFIGISTACTAAVVDMVIEKVSDYKYSTMKTYVDKCIKGDCLIQPLLIWVAYNGVFVLIGSAAVVFIAPSAAGSGIPAIKCYLNGVKIPDVVRIKTYFVKAIGVILSVVGGLACGKEGPMIHCGAVIAAGISQGKSTTFRKDFKIFQQFRADHEKRDFVSAGAAAGVAAAFGAPVGGVLFSLEEGASFWNQSLTWRIFFCSVISAFSLNLILSAYHGHPGQLSYSGLINFGKFEDITYSFNELPVYIIIGAVGGLLGALFNYLNSRLTMFRMKYCHQKWKQILEAVMVAMITAVVGFNMIYYSQDCQFLGNDPIKYPLQFKCGDGEYSALGAIWFQTPEASVRSLFHDPPGSWSPVSLAIFSILYFFLALWTYGISVSSGLFIPALLIGAAWGRLLGIFTEKIFTDHDWVDPGKFALLGAAAMLGGVVRMTLSLTVILIEATGNLTLGLPLMISLMVAKWVGDFFTEGVYDMHVQLTNVPLLGWSAPPLSHNIYASEVMSTPVTTFKSVERVGCIVKVLKSQPHNGFPVVDEPGDSGYDAGTFGRFRGLILRWQLIVILQHKLYNETAEYSWPSRKLTLNDFRDAYPRYPPIHQVQISDQEMDFTIDLRPYMNPSAYTVTSTASLPRIFPLFRALGLRHLIVVNDYNEVVGIVTRKDLARYHLWTHTGRMGLEELHISHG